MEVREATLSDLDAIDSFEIFAGDRKSDVEKGECFVAVEEGSAVGYAVFNKSFYLKPFIQFLCVRPEFYRQGVASKLLEYVEGIYDEGKIFTSTESDNLAMLRLFDRRGYHVSGVIENIQERSEIVFCKELKKVVDVLSTHAYCNPR